MRNNNSHIPASTIVNDRVLNPTIMIATLVGAILMIVLAFAVYFLKQAWRVLGADKHDAG